MKYIKQFPKSYIDMITRFEELIWKYGYTKLYNIYIDKYAYDHLTKGLP